MLKCVRVLRDMMSAPTWKGLITEELHPGKQYQTDEELKKYHGKHHGNCLPPRGYLQNGARCTSCCR